MKAKKAKHNKIRQMSHNKLLEKQEKLRELDKRKKEEESKEEKIMKKYEGYVSHTYSFLSNL